MCIPCGDSVGDSSENVKAQRARQSPAASEGARDSTHDTRTFTAAIRNRIFALLRGLVVGDFEAALAQLRESGQPVLRLRRIGSLA